MDPVDINGEEMKKSVFLTTVISLDNMTGVSMPQLPEKDLHGRSLESFCQFLLAMVFLRERMVMPTMYVCIESYCIPVKYGLQHSKMSPVSSAMI